MSITKKQLLDYGMVEQEQPTVFPMSKDISDENDDGETICIAVTTLRNTQEFCLVLPGGHILYLNINSMEELQAFEQSINAYEPPY